MLRKDSANCKQWQGLHCRRQPAWSMRHRVALLAEPLWLRSTLTTAIDLPCALLQAVHYAMDYNFHYTTIHLSRLVSRNTVSAEEGRLLRWHGLSCRCSARCGIYTEEAAKRR